MTGYNNPNKDPNNMCVEIECASGTTKTPKVNTFPGADNVTEFVFEFKNDQPWPTPILGVLKKDKNISFVYGNEDEIPMIAFEDTLAYFYTYANEQQVKDLDVVVSNIEGDVKFYFENSDFYKLAQRQSDGTISTPEKELTINISSKEKQSLNLVVVFYPRNRTSNDDFFETRLLAQSDDFVRILPIKGKSRRASVATIPTAFDATDVTDNSFVASWSTEEKATGYYLSVYNKEDKSSSEIESFEYFDEGHNPKAWYYNFISVDKNKFASAPLSLAFTSENDTLWTKDYILPVSSFDFWIHSVANAAGNIIVDAFVDSIWTNVLTQPFDAQTKNAIIECDLESDCYKFRLYVKFDTEKGSLLFDDFAANFDNTAVYVLNDEEFLQEEDVENKVVVRNYNPKKTYYYRVRSTDKQMRDEEGRFENLSEYSNEICVGNNEDGSVDIIPLNITFVEDHFVVNLTDVKPNYVIYIYSADGHLVEEIVPMGKVVDLPRLEANMYVVKYSEKGKIRRKDQMGKIFY